MSYSVGYPVNFTSGGDKTNQAIQKFINEFTRLYGYLNTEAAKIPADASGLDVTDAGGYFAAENIEGILQEIGALLATLGDLATEDTVGEDLLSLSDVTTGDASATKHGFLPKLPDDDGQVLKGDGSWAAPAAAFQYICIVDQKAQGTSGGNATSGVWMTRDLNTIRTDQTGAVSVGSNQITLPAGTYVVDIAVPSFGASTNQARLYDISNSAVLLNGNSAAEGSNEVGSISQIKGLITLAAETVVSVQWRCNESRTSGLGTALNAADTPEVYTQVTLLKIA